MGKGWIAVVLAASLAVGCEDPKPKPGADAKAGASAKPSAAATAAATTPKPKTMPELTVDPEGPYLAGRRIELGAPGGREKLTEVVKDLPIDGKPVTLIADKKAKVPHVAAVVEELGVAGAPKVLIKTNGRDDLPKEIEVTPQKRVASPPGCSVTASVLKDLSTAVWPAKGGLGKRQRKGLAGPDLSHTSETLEKEIAACDSTMAFFSSDDEVGWEGAFNIAGTLVNADKKKKIDTLVLLKEAPVAGRALPFVK